MSVKSMKNKVLLMSLLIPFAPTSQAGALSLSDDYQSMMQWLTNETVQGLAFNTGSTFDPPTELRPWHVQPDVSLGVGVVPLNKSKFPTPSVPGLADLNPASLFPNAVTFPNLTLHMRLGLPDRWDFSVRAVDMTVPDGYRMTPKTTGSGQSNTIGCAVRRHFFGGDDPLLSMSANYNHVFGRFNFMNKFNGLVLSPDFTTDATNTGQLAWDVRSFGLNAVVSQSIGAWTPFLGIGGNIMAGSVRGRLQSNFDSDLLLPAIGEASSKPEQLQSRAIFGVQMDRARYGLFLNGEIKTSGASAGKTFIISSGILAPFGIGSSSTLGRESNAGAVKAANSLAYDVWPKTESLGTPTEGKCDHCTMKKIKKKRTSDEDVPPLIFLQ